MQRPERNSSFRNSLYRIAYRIRHWTGNIDRVERSARTNGLVIARCEGTAGLPIAPVKNLRLAQQLPIDVLARKSQQAHGRLT
ncbi:hypothetical protein [Crateriforma conspicua]|uniref:hypothetical protein n=1 Tax=Crateriforma conspicua TaxID=2527996 RepID=UPI0011A5EC8E|nr:hypothetical protein [Crateriforma conspicua]